MTVATASMPLQTPLHAWHTAHGARLVDFAGWSMPIQYTNITEEHVAVRTGAGLFDICHMGRLVFQGRDALALIQKLFTNDAATMKLGQVRYGLVCNQRGGIRDDVLVYRFPDDWLMVVNASNRPKILTWIDENRGGMQVVITDETLNWGMVAVQGPKAVAIVAGCGELFPGVNFRGGDQLKYYFCQSVMSGSERIILSRTGYTGEDGIELIVPAAKLVRLCEELMASAKRLGLELRPCGLGARDTLRLEAAMPLYGHELSEEIDPFQAGLDWAVKMSKGEFLGRAALESRQKEAQLPVRVGLELEGKRIAREGAVVSSQSQEVGRVTSGTFTPTLGKAVAMAYVPRELSATGTTLDVDVRGKPATARVVPMPFYKRNR